MCVTALALGMLLDLNMLPWQHACAEVCSSVFAAATPCPLCFRMCLYSLYKVFDMTTSADYRLLFTLPAAGVADVKLGPQYLLLVHTPCPAAAADRRDLDSSQQPPAGSRLQLGGSGDACVGASCVQLSVYATANGQVRALGVLVCVAFVFAC